MKLNHGLSILGEGYGINHAYQYLGELVSYTAHDFFRTHMWIVYLMIETLNTFFYRKKETYSEADCEYPPDRKDL